MSNSSNIDLLKYRIKLLTNRSAIICTNFLIFSSLSFSFRNSSILALLQSYTLLPSLYNWPNGRHITRHPMATVLTWQPVYLVYSTFWPTLPVHISCTWNTGAAPQSRQKSKSTDPKATKKINFEISAIN